MTETPISRNPNFKFPELTAETRELCAGDQSRGDVTIPSRILEQRPQGISPAGWTRMLAEGEQFRRAEGCASKAVMAERMLDRGIAKNER